MHSGRQKKSLKHILFWVVVLAELLFENLSGVVVLVPVCCFPHIHSLPHKGASAPSVFPHPLLAVGCVGSGMFIPLAPCSFYHVLLPSSWQVASPADQLSPACNNCSLLASFEPGGGGSFLPFPFLGAPLFLLSSCHPPPTSANTHLSKLLSIKPCVCELFLAGPEPMQLLRRSSRFRNFWLIICLNRFFVPLSLSALSGIPKYIVLSDGVRWFS